jgi:hypothetical protein
MTPIAMIALGVSSAASAQVREVSPGDYYCSAAAGQAVNKQIPPLQVGKPVTVRFRYIADHSTPKLQSQGAVYFMTPSGTMGVLVGRDPDDPDHVYVDLMNGRSRYYELVARYHVTNLFIAVDLTLTGNGTVMVKSGQLNELKLNTRSPVETDLHCHAGDFEIQVVRPQG